MMRVETFFGDVVREKLQIRVVIFCSGLGDREIPDHSTDISERDIQRVTERVNPRGLACADDDCRLTPVRDEIFRDGCDPRFADTGDVLRAGNRRAWPSVDFRRELFSEREQIRARVLRGDAKAMIRIQPRVIVISEAGDRIQPRPYYRL